MQYRSVRKKSFFDWDWLDEKPAPVTVYETDDYETGLCDKDGNPIVRVREPIGFKLNES